MSDDDILYLDNSIIVVFKKANLLSQGDATFDISLFDMVKDYIKKKYHKPGNVYLGLVHRLDRPVSGIMVFARRSKDAKRLSEEIKNGQFQKTYIAVVHGILEEDEATFVDYLFRDYKGNTRVSSPDKGKKSILHYKVLKRNSSANKTLVEIHLVTGRHHQIRVQFASRGFFLCGDQRYGVEDRTQIALCAYKLKFFHPIKKELLTFQVDIPTGVHWDDFSIS